MPPRLSKTYTCRFCGTTFTKFESHNRHVMKNHKNIIRDPYRYAYAEQSASSLPTFMSNPSNCDEKPPKCEIRRSNDLKFHCAIAGCTHSEQTERYFRAHCRYMHRKELVLKEEVETYTALTSNGKEVEKLFYQPKIKLPRRKKNSPSPLESELDFDSEDDKELSSDSSKKSTSTPEAEKESEKEPKVKLSRFQEKLMRMPVVAFTYTITLPQAPRPPAKKPSTSKKASA